jgi:hypothetical protein
MASHWTNHLSVVGGGQNAVTVEDRLFTGRSLHLAPGEVLALTGEEGSSTSPGDPGGPVWGPDPLPLQAFHVLQLSADALAAPGEAAAAVNPHLADMNPDDTLKIELVGGPTVDLGAVLDAIEPAAPVAGHVVIEFTSENE